MFQFQQIILPHKRAKPKYQEQVYINHKNNHSKFLSPEEQQKFIKQHYRTPFDIDKIQSYKEQQIQAHIKIEDRIMMYLYQMKKLKEYQMRYFRHGIEIKPKDGGLLIEGYDADYISQGFQEIEDYTKDLICETLDTDNYNYFIDLIKSPQFDIYRNNICFLTKQRVDQIVYQLDTEFHFDINPPRFNNYVIYICKQSLQTYVQLKLLRPLLMTLPIQFARRPTYELLKLTKHQMLLFIIKMLPIEQLQNTYRVTLSIKQNQELHISGQNYDDARDACNYIVNEMGSLTLTEIDFDMSSIPKDQLSFAADLLKQFEPKGVHFYQSQLLFDRIYRFDSQFGTLFGTELLCSMKYPELLYMIGPINFQSDIISILKQFTTQQITQVQEYIVVLTQEIIAKYNLFPLQKCSEYIIDTYYVSIDIRTLKQILFHTNSLGNNYEAIRQMEFIRQVQTLEEFQQNIPKKKEHYFYIDQSQPNIGILRSKLPKGTYKYGMVLIPDYDQFDLKSNHHKIMQYYELCSGDIVIG